MPRDNAMLPGVASAIRAARLNAGFSQRELARRSGLDSTHISRLETWTMDPGVTVFLQLADALEVPAGELLEDARRRQQLIDTGELKANEPKPAPPRPGHGRDRRRKINPNSPPPAILDATLRHTLNPAPAA